MHPWIVLPGGLALPAYFTSITVGLVVGTFVLRREAVREGLRVRDVFDLALVVIPCALVGARLLVALDDPLRYARAPWLLLYGGWTSYGAFLGMMTGVTGTAVVKGLDGRRVADVFAPAIALGHAFGRLGCLAGGCCHGRPADWPLGVEVPWSVRYYLPGHAPAELLAVPLHPSPLYESLAMIGLFTWISLGRPRQAYAGQAMVRLLGGYGVARFVLEFFRGDLERGFVGPLSVEQLVSVGFVLAAALLSRFRS